MPDPRRHLEAAGFTVVGPVQHALGVWRAVALRPSPFRSPASPQRTIAIDACGATADEALALLSAAALATPRSSAARRS